jgi:signal transduction histidine kinase
MSRSTTLARAGAAAAIAMALAALLQSSDATTMATIVAAAAMAAAAAGLWLAPALSASQVALLAPAGVLLIVATGVDEPVTASVQANAQAAGALVIALSTAAVLAHRSRRIAALVGGIVAGGVHALLYDPFTDQRCDDCGHAAVALWADADWAGAIWWIGFGLMAAAIIASARRLEALVMSPAVVAFALDPYRRWLATFAVATATAVWGYRCWLAGRHNLAVRRLSGLQYTDEDIVAALERSVRRGATIDDLGLDPETAFRVHNVRLTALLAARVDELDRERRQVVQAGLAERRSLERNLHDSVQQELLALGLDLRLASGVRPEGSVDQPTLGRALALIHDCVDQVRVISTGASPPMLATHGLRHAIEALMRRRGDPQHVTLDLTELPDTRLPDDVTRAAFAVIVEAFSRGATRIRAAVCESRLEINASGTSDAPDVGWAEGILPDLVAAVGGSLRSSGAGIQAVIPCA